MSRIGKQPILIPKQVNLEKNDNLIIAKGPKGSLSFKIPEGILSEIKENQIFISLKDNNKSNISSKVKALWGLTRAIIANNVDGVLKGHKKELEIRGIGYKAVIQDKKIVLLVGFSHPVEKDIPNDIECSIKNKIITITGIDKQKVGQFAAEIREIRKPEPYKGKGIRYVDEVVRKKQGKKVVTK